jgi:hypothetical protein
MKRYLLIVITFLFIIFNISGCSKKEKHDNNDINVIDNNNISKAIGKTEDIDSTEDNKSLNPINFESDQVSYINYIRDRSFMGELTDLCYYVEDKQKIKEILDCIDNDIVFQNQLINKEDFKFSDGNNVIKLEIFLEDDTEHKLFYAKDHLYYDSVEYQIYSYNDLLSSAWVDILSEYKPTEVESD